MVNMWGCICTLEEFYNPSTVGGLNLNFDPSELERNMEILQLLVDAGKSAQYAPPLQEGLPAVLDLASEIRNAKEKHFALGQITFSARIANLHCEIPCPHFYSAPIYESMRFMFATELKLEWIIDRINRINRINRIIVSVDLCIVFIINIKIQF